MSVADSHPNDWRHVRLANFDVIDTSPQQLRSYILNRLSSASTPLTIAFFNSNFALSLHRATLAPEPFRNWLLPNDGIAASLAAKMVSGYGFVHNLNGTDFTPYLLQGLPNGTRVALYGAKPEVVARAAKVVADLGDIEVTAAIDGYGHKDAAAAEKLYASKADVILVALGNPLQERWIMDHGAAAGARLYLGVGALFDFWAGNARRAPIWVQKCRLEWAFRLLQEPRRLLQRYTLDMVRFFLLVRRLKT